MPDIKAFAAKTRGLAPRATINEARAGAVFAVKDDAISFPEERLGGARTTHYTRRVIIIQAQKLIIASRPCTIYVLPCSASQAGASGEWDLLLPSNEEGFDGTSIVAYTSLLQPILKSDLVKCYGYVQESTLLHIQSMIAMNLGLIPSSHVKLPSRNAQAEQAKTDDVITSTAHAVVQFSGSSDVERSTE